MKTLIIFVLLFSCSLVYADYATLSGVSWTPVTKTYSTTGTASGAVVWTPATGRRIILLGAFFSQSVGANPSTTINLQTDFTVAAGGTNVIPAIGIATGPVVISSSVPIWQGATNGQLYITTNKSITPSVVLWGYEN